MTFDCSDMACCGLRPLSHLLPMFVLMLICGFILLVRFIVNIICKGPKCMFSHRSRNVKPEILRNSEFGKHQFHRLPVRVSVLTSCLEPRCLCSDYRQNSDRNPHLLSTLSRSKVRPTYIFDVNI